MGTWRKMNGENAVLRPFMAFPDEIGITKDNWKDSAVAKFFTVDEGKKYLLPTPETAFYVAKGYTLPVSVEAERIRAVLMADPDLNKPAPATLRSADFKI
jgi:hypothetical protein